MPHPHLAIEFIFRYVQLCSDRKCHYAALKLAGEDFTAKIDYHNTFENTYSFKDGSSCIWLGDEWELHSKII